MNRRRYLATMGLLAGGNATAMGTGAFTSVSAERKISVSLADDFRAFLRLEPNENEGISGMPTGRSSTSGSVVRFDIPGYQSGENQDAKGVGPDSIYEFHDLLEIGNHGNQPVTVQSEYAGDNFQELALVTSDGRLSENPPTLDVGDNIDVGLYIDTHGSDTGDYVESLIIVAERVGGNRD